MTCIRAIYDEIGMSKLIKKLGEIWMLILNYLAPNTVSVVNTAVLNGNTTAIYGSAYQPYPETQPGYLIVQFPGRKFFLNYIFLSISNNEWDFRES
jgi:hypothetical protein